MIEGSCNCQSVQYEVDGAIKKIVNCHCNLCRKMNGSAFSTYAVVLDTDFKLTSGTLVSTKVTDKSSKSVCDYCYTPIYNQNPEYAGLKMLYLGSLESNNNLLPEINIYCESRLTWLDTINKLPKFDQAIQ
jgi:hypothetical protein